MTTDSIVLGDAIQTLSAFPDGCVHLTVFSPPYDGIRDYGGDWTLDYKTLGDQLFRVTADGGVCAVVIGDGTKNFAKSLTTARWTVDWVDRAGWKLFEHCIYRRHGVPGKFLRFRIDHESILIFFKGKRPRVFNPEQLRVPTLHPGRVSGGTSTHRQRDGRLRPISPRVTGDTKCRGTVWEYAASNTEGNKTKLRHPATMPDKLASDLILCFSHPGDLVLDPMCGSGTTCVMAAESGRRYLGIEVNPGYRDIALDRLRDEGYTLIPT